MMKNLPGLQEASCNAGDLGLIPGSRRFPGKGNGHPFQYSCLENPTDRGDWWPTVHGSQRVGHHSTTIIQNDNIEDYILLIKIYFQKTLFVVVVPKSCLTLLQPHGL